MARKTFDVSKIKDRVNFYLLNSKDSNRGERRGMMTMLEGILHDSGNYRGFGYLSVRDMENSVNGTTYGVRPYADSEELKMMQAEGTLFDGTDNTRIHYF